MNMFDFIAQPRFRSTQQVIDGVLATATMKRIDIAAAYITSSGIDVLLKTMRERDCADNKRVVKRWITSFDYCRTEPIALKTLLSLPSSRIRIHDAQTCLAQRGVPKVPFHPKTFLFHSRQFDHVLAGSGNISRSGLSRGFEAGIVIGIDRSGKPAVPSVRASLRGLQNFFETTWKAAVPLTAKILATYDELFESIERLKNPVPTEDDIASGDTSTGALSSEDLKKLRVCRRFWIEAGNITKNRGPNLPGNQLMMKRLSRVFFGFAPVAVPENTHLGDVGISYKKHFGNYSLTYSDNKMDKLVLPIPGPGGLTAYDGRYLLFERTRPRQFRFSFGSKIERIAWLTNSQRIDAAFKMSSGRQWGVF